MDENLEEKQIGLYELFLTIRDPDRMLFQNTVDAISTYNNRGLFDVLPVHENFITIIQDSVIVHIKEKVQKFEFKKGILKVEENEVLIFLNAEKL